MKTRVIASVLCAAWLLALPVHVHAWGFDVHRLITGRAIDGLPAELKPLFAAHRAFVVEHVIDPDMWRVIGLRSAFGDTDPDHFLDIDDMGEPAPFAHVPRTWDGLVAKYGPERAAKIGRLPYRAEDLFNRLVDAFRDLGKPSPPPWAADDARYFSAVLSHYIEDAYQPFHATVNYDGRATNQRGIHARFETDVVMRNYDRIPLTPVTVTPIPDINAFMFRVIVDSQALVEPALRADRDAAAGREFYDDAYFDAFFKNVEPMLARRLSEAANGTASVIAAAWRAAGSPQPPPEGRRPPARIVR